MKIIKSERGSISSYVVLSLTFFLVIVVGIYTTNNRRLQKQERDVKMIEASYNEYDANVVYDVSYTNSIIKILEAKINEVNNKNYIKEDYLLSSYNNLENAIKNAQNLIDYSEGTDKIEKLKAEGEDSNLQKAIDEAENNLLKSSVKTSDEFANVLKNCQNGDTIYIDGKFNISDELTLNKSVNIIGNTDSKVIFDNPNSVINISGSPSILIKNVDFETSGTKTQKWLIHAKENTNLTIEDSIFIAPEVAVLANDNSIVMINSGTFKAITKNDNHYWTLNEQNGTNAKIIVRGGTFYQFDPANGNTEDPPKSFVDEGYVSKQDGENYIVSLDTQDTKN